MAILDRSLTADKQVVGALLAAGVACAGTACSDTVRDCGGGIEIEIATTAVARGEADTLWVQVTVDGSIMKEAMWPAADLPDTASLVVTFPERAGETFDVSVQAALREGERTLANANGELDDFLARTTGCTSLPLVLAPADKDTDAGTDGGVVVTPPTDAGVDALLPCEEVSVPGDEDDDTFLDNLDNCPHVPNTQENSDGDELGDACDRDNTRYDTIVLFDGFNQNSVCKYAHSEGWALGNGQASYTETGAGHGFLLLQHEVGAGGSVAVSWSATVQAGSAADSGAGAFMAASNVGVGGWSCQFQPAPSVVSLKQALDGAEIEGRPFSVTEGQSYRGRMALKTDDTGNNLSCEVSGTESATVSGTDDDLTRTVGDFGLGALTTDAAFDYLLIVETCEGIGPCSLDTGRQR